MSTRALGSAALDGSATDAGVGGAPDNNNNVLHMLGLPSRGVVTRETVCEW